MAKKCIFCGERPVNKNKEHVIPQWLIKLTGPPNRTVLIGKRNGKEIKFSWMNYVFPACEVCNSDFAKKEAAVKTTLLKLLDEKPLVHDEMNLFLDWLDKIRIGVWLGHAQLFQKQIEPNFHINQRVGKSDRMCLFYKTNKDAKGIGITGTETAIFEHIPSCFGLRINDLLILNYSKEFLISKNLGFPYPVNYKYVEGIKISIDRFTLGTSNINNPIIEGKIIKPSIKLYQAIIKCKHNLKRPAFGKALKFLRTNGFKFNSDLIQSRIYLSNENTGENEFWARKDKHLLKFSQKIDSNIIMDVVAQMVFEYQIHSARELEKGMEGAELKNRKEIIDFYDMLIEFNQKELDRLNVLLAPYTKVI